MQRRSFLSSAVLLTGGVLLPDAVLAGGPSAVCGIDKKARAKLHAERLTGQLTYSPASASAKDGTPVARCWLACLQMVFRYHGYTVSAQRIRDEVYKGKVPSKPWEDLSPLKHGLSDDKGHKFGVLTEVLAVRASDAAELLNDNQPLIIGAFGHPVLLTGMSYTGDRLGGLTLVDATVLDPTPGTGTRVICSPDWVNVSFISHVSVRKSSGKT
jgi:hypothetical protein